MNPCLLVLVPVNARKKKTNNLRSQSLTDKKRDFSYLQHYSAFTAAFLRSPYTCVPQHGNASITRNINIKLHVNERKDQLSLSVKCKIVSLKLNEVLAGL